MGALISLVSRLAENGKHTPEQLPSGEKQYHIPQSSVGKLSKEEKGRLLLVLSGLIERKVYMANDCARDMPVRFAVQFKDELERFRGSGASILYFTSSFPVTVKYGSDGTVVYDGNHWTSMVDYYQKLLDPDGNHELGGLG